ncbi:hypothetical protein [Streptomyces sp. KR55]|uniref:hypothetical protein n=1 Tax=Streptomyces sp. KR55 TaxID=3457425 RepID=UPI003FD5C181
MSRLRTLAAAGITAALLVGGTATTANAASTGCWSSWGVVKTTANVNYRTGPGTSYTVKGILTEGTRANAKCWENGYMKVYPTTGAWAGTSGWVHGDYLLNIS